MRNILLKRLVCFSVILMFFGVLACRMIFAQGRQKLKTNWLYSLVSDIEKSRDDLLAQINKAKSNIQNAKNIIYQAQGGNNKEAEDIGSQALRVAQEAKEKALGEKSQLEKRIKNIRKKLSRLAKSDFQIESVVTGYSGEAFYYSKKTGKKVSLSENPMTYLEPGDRIITGENGSVQMFCFKGRGKIEIKGNTILEVKNSDGLLDLAVGQINLKVKKIGKKLKEYSDEYFPPSVCTPTAVIAVRGTEFSVFVDKSKAADIFVYEGRVEVSEISKGEKTTKIIVEAGEKVNISAKGIIGEIQDFTPGAILE